jgi:hypothetical protein
VLNSLRRSLFETGDANQFILQSCGSFRRTLLAGKHGVHFLDISVSHTRVFIASDVRRTRNRARLERLTQKGKTGIWFNYLRQVLEFR